MEDVLDPINPELEEPTYLRRSGVLLIINCVLFVVMFDVSYMSLEDQSPLRDVTIALTFFAMVFLAPVGLFYSVKSFWRKAESSIKRVLCTCGHGFFCILIVVMFAVIFSDLANFL